MNLEFLVKLHYLAFNLKGLNYLLLNLCFKYQLLIQKHFLFIHETMIDAIKDCKNFSLLT